MSQPVQVLSLWEMVVTRPKLISEGETMSDESKRDATEPSEHLMPRPEPYWQPLFDHMSENYGLTLIEDEMHQIARAVDKCRTNPFTLCAHCKHWQTVVEPNYQARGQCAGTQSPNIGLKTSGNCGCRYGEPLNDERSNPAPKI